MRVVLTPFSHQRLFLELTIAGSRLLVFVLGFAIPMAVNMFDTAMEEYGGPDWHYTVLSMPVRGAKATTDIVSPLTVDMFIEHALRSTTGVRTTWALYDVQRAVPEMGVQSLAEAVATQNYATLPQELRPGGDVPDDAKLSSVAQNNGDGAMLVVKAYLFDKSKSIKDVMALGLSEEWHTSQSIGRGHGHSRRPSSPSWTGSQAIMLLGPP